MKIPIATYRLQFNHAFKFEGAKGIVDYLVKLGISDIYASPIFKAKAGSLHGYDVVDPQRINPELGSEQDLDELFSRVNSAGLGWIQDIVPNHQAYDQDNPVLMDVFENGKSSEFYHFFDVQWEHIYDGKKGRVLAPFLSDFFGNCLEDGQIRLKYSSAGISVNFLNNSFPLGIESYAKILKNRLDLFLQAGVSQGQDSAELMELIGLLNNLKEEGETGKKYEKVAEIKKRMWQLYNKSALFKKHLESVLEGYNGEKNNPQSFDLLDELLGEQMYRLAFWKIANEDINYRRFFTISNLISVRNEDEKFREYSHNFIFKLIQENKINGLRIDHIDGLADPQEYLNFLRNRLGDFYIVLEKILTQEEQLNGRWPVQGTTGYDFLSQCNYILCQPENEKNFDKLYFRFLNSRISFEELVSSKKKLIIQKYLAGELDNLASFLKNMFTQNRYARDFTIYALKDSLIEALSLFPVYRSYVNENGLSESDRHSIEETFKKAKKRIPDFAHELYFIQKIMLLDFDNYLKQENMAQCLEFIRRFQQFSSVLTAKGLEDTVLYIFNRLLSLNEVGTIPARFGSKITDFHAFNMKRQAFFPLTLNCSSTQDTKRGEDVRARISVLSEIPREWETKIRFWHRVNKRKKAAFPDKNDEYFLYQNLVGALPFEQKDFGDFKKRLKDYMVKSVREAKLHTEWINPDVEYEKSCLLFIDRLFSKDSKFMADFLPFAEKISFYGMLNSLSQTLLKLTCPGIPDFYQGSEFWELNLVDPDNRRPVDFKARQKQLEEILSFENSIELADQLLAQWKDPKIKLFLINRVLMQRKNEVQLFQKGAYIPLLVEGSFKDHIIAFLRKLENKVFMVVTARHFTELVAEKSFPLGRQIWQDTKILFPDKEKIDWVNAFTRENFTSFGEVYVGDVLNRFPFLFSLGNKERLS